MQYGDHVQVGESQMFPNICIPNNFTRSHLPKLKPHIHHEKLITHFYREPKPSQCFLLIITTTGDTTNVRSNPKPTENTHNITVNPHNLAHCYTLTEASHNRLILSSVQIANNNIEPMSNYNGKHFQDSPGTCIYS